MKTCLYCNIEILGRKSKFCSKSHGYSWRNKHIYNYSYTKAFRARSPRNYLGQLRSYYNRKETLSLDFLESLYYKQNGMCAISGEILTFIQDGGRQSTNISIDRINNSLGYTEDNTQLVCHKANMMKGESDLAELKEWCNKILTCLG